MKEILASQTMPETFKTKLTYILQVYESNKAYLVYSQPDY